jgi:hypothetical protein
MSSYLLPVITPYSHSSRNFLLILSRCVMLLHTEGRVLSQFKQDERGVAWFHAFLTSAFNGNDQLRTPDHPTLKKGRGYPLRTGVWWISESVWMLPRHENTQFLPQIKHPFTLVTILNPGHICCM